MNIRPLQDQILVKRDLEEEVSPGGIIVTPGINPKLPRGRGIVLAVGPGRKRERTVDTTARIAIIGLASGCGLPVAAVEALIEAFNEGDTLDPYEPMDVKVGDRVIFSKLSGDKVRDDLAQADVDDDLLLIRESEVIAILDDKDAP